MFFRKETIKFWEWDVGWAKEGKGVNIGTIFIITYWDNML